MKVLTAEIYHETNTFSCRITDEQAFRNRCLLMGDAAIVERGKVNTELAGFLNAGHLFNWQVDHVISASAGPSGKVTDQVFDFLCDSLVDAIGRHRYDGVLLGLHGAMVTNSYDDGEGEILNRLRAVIDTDIPVAITLDLHANVSQLMCTLADIIVSYKTYPHIDMYETGMQAAEILQKTMSGLIKPRTIRVNCPMLEEVNGARTDIGPMIERISKAKSYENNNDVFAVSINGGFASSDIAEVGPTVLVTAQGDFDAHRRFAESIAKDIWDKRFEVLNDYMSVESAAAMAQNFKPDDGPLVIADYADNPGAGAYGDSTNLLRALIDAEIDNACFGPIVDAETVQVLTNNKPGDQVSLTLGGKTDPSIGGMPLKLSAELISFADGDYIGDGPMVGGLHASFGPSAVIRVAGIVILIVSISSQMLDLQQFKTFGINPESKAIVALKSMQHFRAAFEPIAGKVIVCDSEALCTPRYQRMNYQKVPRPMFPLDQ